MKDKAVTFYFSAQEIAHARTIDKAAQEMIVKAIEDGVETAWDRLLKQQPQCGYGQLGICCTNCALGPCRIEPSGNEPQRGVCGATADTIVARNLATMLASGAAAHSDHGREVVEVAYKTALGEAQGYEITDVEKLKRVATEYGVDTSQSKEDMARDLALAMLDEFGTIKDTIQLAERAPAQRKALWHNVGIWPRSVDREIVEIMHRVHMGVDADYASILVQALRASLSDGWGGSMMATEFSDILFGTPTPKESWVNLGVLSKDQVNIVLHGHNPVLSEMVVKASRDPELIALAKEKGAAGINLVGMCCTGNELLMRQGVPIAGNMLNQELALVTGAVEVMIIDYQCIFPSITETAKCYHTQVVSTSSKAHVPGAIHKEFHPESAMDTAKEIVRMAVDNFPNRNPARVKIPNQPIRLVAGFSAEAIVSALGGSVDPLVEAIKSGQIRGVAGIVGCNNPKIKQDYGHVTLTKRLIENDVLVVETGCAAIASGKAGLMVPEAADMAGPGLSAVAKALGIPPVLHMGSCVDCSRILVLAGELAKALNIDISDLPLAGAAPEWYSQKAVSIGTYFVASGVYTVLGLPPRIYGSKAVTELLADGLNGVVGAAFAIEPDPNKAADLMLAHIDQKRKALGI